MKTIFFGSVSATALMLAASPALAQYGYPIVAVGGDAANGSYNDNSSRYTDSSDTTKVTNTTSGANSGAQVAANNGSAATDSRDMSTTDDHTQTTNSTALTLTDESAASAGQVAANNGGHATDSRDQSTNDYSDHSTTGGNSGAQVAANNGSTATDSRNMSTTDNSDRSNTYNDYADRSTTNTDHSTHSTTNTDNSNRSTASGAQVAANNGSEASDNRDYSTTDKLTAHNDGTGSAASGGNAYYTDSSTTETGTADAGTGAAATTNQFGASAVVSSANLASYVTGVQVSYDVPSGGSTGGPDNRLTTGDGAFQNFAGIQSLNMNTGVAASQNSTVNVAVSAGAINLR